MFAKRPEAGGSSAPEGGGSNNPRTPAPDINLEALTDQWLEKEATKSEKKEMQCLRHELAVNNARVSVRRQIAEQQLAIARTEHELREYRPKGWWAKTKSVAKETTKLTVKDGLPLAAGLGAPWAPALLQSAGVNAGHGGAPLTYASLGSTLAAAAPGAFLGYAAGRSLGKRYAETAVGQTLWKTAGTTSGAVLSYNAIPYLYGLGPIGFLAAPSTPLILSGGITAGLAYGAGRAARKMRGQSDAGVLRTMGTGLALPVTLPVAGAKYAVNSWRSVNQSVHNWGWDKKTPSSGAVASTFGLATGLVGAVAYRPLRAATRTVAWPFKKVGSGVSKGVKGGFKRTKKLSHWLFVEKPDYHT